MDRLNKLKKLEAFLCGLLQDADMKSVASIAKQYRETLAEIEALEGNAKPNDEIGELLKNRQANGKSNAVRKNRSELPPN